MKNWLAQIGLLLCLGMGAGAAKAVPTLFDWGFNLNGETHCNLGPCDFDFLDPSLDLPAAIDASGFDFFTGLGSISITVNPGVAGNFHTLVFLDHEFDDVLGNGPFNEFGDVSGAPEVGQTWEIDDPVVGDIFGNFVGNTLDNSNAVIAGLEGDVSMSLGFDFALTAMQSAMMTFIVSDAVPTGFYLSHTDPDDGETLYFSSTLEIDGGMVAVNEPGAIALLVAGLFGVLAAASFCRRQERAQMLHAKFG